MADYVRDFQQKLIEAGLAVDCPLCDGLLHRCGTVDKPHSKNGAYIIFADQPASLWWKNWATGDEGTQCSKTHTTLTPAEREAFTKRVAEAKATAAQDKTRRHLAAAQKAKALWERATVASNDHPYLVQKGVPAIALRTMGKGNALVVPFLNTAGGLQSLQFIDADGVKRFLTGGKIQGGFCPIPAKDGAKDGPLCICEGYATAASIHLATGHAVLCAFNAGNLLSVAEAARALYPQRQLILCADNDVKPDAPNTGLDAATAAAQAVNGLLAVPPAHEGKPTDFNDLHQWRGLDAVRACVEEAQPAPTHYAEKLPVGFSLRTGGALPGLWHTEPKESGDPVETWIGPPLHVLGATRDEHGNAWGLFLEWEDPDGRAHTWAMPKSLLVGKDTSAWLGRLTDEGWSGSPLSRARNLLATYLATYRTIRRALCVPCTGWHRGAFVLPDAVLIKPTGRTGRTGQAYSHNDLSPSSCFTGQLDELENERIVLQVQTPHNPFRMAGTLDGWRDTVGAWARGNSRIMLAVCASLAAPLLEVSGQESGGFNWTGQSSTGKTTALVAAGSAWGKGASSGGYVLNWRATANGLEGLAALHSDAALCLDEIGQAPGRTIFEAAYMLANGMGKARAFADGSARAAKAWRCLVLSTGEKGLAEKIADEGGKVQAGQTVRLIDIPADAGAGMGIFETLHGHTSSRELSDSMKHAAATNYGHAARAFIAEIQKDRNGIQEGLYSALGKAGKLLCPAGASGQVERVARRFALCVAAGEMATEWGILPWSEGEALQAVKVCFEAWLALRGGAGTAEDTTIVEQVTLFLEQHGQSRFHDVEHPTATVINRAGFRRQANGGIEFFVLPESFKTEICKGINHKRAAAVLADKGLLIPGDSNSFTRRPAVDLPGFGRRRCYTLFVGGESDGLA